MPATDALYDILQRAANVEGTRATTVDTQAMAQQRMFALGQQIQTQQALADFARKQQENVPPSPGMGPGFDNGPLAFASDQIRQLNREATSLEGLSRVLLPINQKAAHDAIQTSSQIREHIAGKTFDLIKSQGDLDKHIGGVAGAAADAAAAGDQDNFVAGLRQMIALDPNALRGMKLQTTPDGIPLATQANAAALQNKSTMTLSRAEQNADKARQAQIAETGARDRATEEDRLARLEQRKAESNANIALRQSGQEALEFQRQQSRQQHITSQGTTVNNQYETQSKDFREIVPRVESATAYLIDPKTGKLKDNSQFNSSGDRMFAETYIKTVYPDYRGSVYDQKSLATLPGLATKILQGFKNIATGQMIDRDVKADMYGAMQQAFKPMNEDQIRREDAAMTRATRAGIPVDDARFYVPPHALRPTQPKSAPATPSTTAAVSTGAILTATNPATGAKIKSTDGGKTWQPM